MGILSLINSADIMATRTKDGKKERLGFSLPIFFASGLGHAVVSVSYLGELGSRAVIPGNQPWEKLEKGAPSELPN